MIIMNTISEIIFPTPQGNEVLDLSKISGFKDAPIESLTELTDLVNICFGHFDELQYGTQDSIKNLLKLDNGSYSVSDGEDFHFSTPYFSVYKAPDMYKDSNRIIIEYEFIGFYGHFYKTINMESIFVSVNGDNTITFTQNFEKMYQYVMQQ